MGFPSFHSSSRSIEYINVPVHNTPLVMGELTIEWSCRIAAPVLYPWNSIRKTCKIFHGDSMWFHVTYSIQLPWKTSCSILIPSFHGVFHCSHMESNGVSMDSNGISIENFTCFHHRILWHIKPRPLFCRIAKKIKIGYKAARCNT